MPSNAVEITRNPGARWWLTSEDEWYKAAYHKNNGLTGDYWLFPTSSDSVPYSAPPPGTNAPTPSNSANFLRNDGIDNGYNDGFALTGSTILDDDLNYLTEAGAYVDAFSPYGTFDQAGNVFEWNESLILATDGLRRGIRGGSWHFGPNEQMATVRQRALPETVSSAIGFRVATIPEPSSVALAVMAVGGVFVWRLFRR